MGVSAAALLLASRGCIANLLQLTTRTKQPAHGGHDGAITASGGAADARENAGQVQLQNTQARSSPAAPRTAPILAKQTRYLQ
jgi:hypothetical protein